MVWVWYHSYMKITKKEYTSIHQWLKHRYGSPQACENTQCPYKEVGGMKCQYALKRGFKYQKKRENFIELCSTCHARYDRWSDWKLSDSNPQYHGSNSDYVKRTYRIYPEQEVLIKKHGKGNENEHIRKALDYYHGYLAQK